jgi:hypothetical protein
MTMMKTMMTTWTNDGSRVSGDEVGVTRSAAKLHQLGGGPGTPLKMTCIQWVKHPASSVPS